MTYKTYKSRPISPIRPIRLKHPHIFTPATLFLKKNCILFGGKRKIL